MRQIAIKMVLEVLSVYFMTIIDTVKIFCVFEVYYGIISQHWIALPEAINVLGTSSIVIVSIRSVLLIYRNINKASN